MIYINNPTIHHIVQVNDLEVILDSYLSFTILPPQPIHHLVPIWIPKFYLEFILFHVITIATTIIQITTISQLKYAIIF